MLYVVIMMFCCWQLMDYRMRWTTRFFVTFLWKSIHLTTLTPLAWYCDCDCVVSNFLGLICMYQDGMTALMWASSRGQHHVIPSLIQAGASIDRKCRWVCTWHNSYRERHEREESRYKHEDWQPAGKQRHKEDLREIVQAGWRWDYKYGCKSLLQPW